MGSGSAVHRMPASSSAFRPPESWPPPASCCRRESAAALPRNKQRRARVLPETLPSSPPEMLLRSSRPTAASPWRSSAPCIPLRRSYPGFSEVHLCFPRGVGQWHEHLPRSRPMQTHVVLHGRIAARVGVLLPQPVEDPLRRMPLLHGVVLVFF